jgi:superfamily I DNA/RNA helicase
MARLAIDKDFLGDFSKLEKSVQSLVMAAFDKFEGHTYAGLHLEKLNHPKDERIRTIRIDHFWRGVVLASDSGDTYYLIKVMPHDKAIEYAASHKFTVNQALGVVDVRDQAGIEQIQPSLEKAAETTDDRLFARISDMDLTRLGIDEDTLVIARLLTSEAHLDAMRKMIPEVQFNALVGLAAGQTPEEVWAEVAQYAPSEPVDTANLVKAMERTQSRVVFVDSNAELVRILKHPFALWRTFLHPAQRKIAYAPQYAGPAQVTGGAGTGKTVTALHRAAHLARKASEEFPGEKSPPSVLLTTFTRNLAEALQAQLELLVDDDDVRGRVEILNVDRLAYRVAEQRRGSRPAIIDTDTLAGLWATAAAEAGLAFTPTFLVREWEQVILAQDLLTEQDYLTCSRAGQGTPLGKAQRRHVWRLAQVVESQLNAKGRSTFLQLANEAARFLRDSGKPPYRHVIVDEGQDLHPAQWRLLRAAVQPGPDDMFIVGDVHQRIYENHVSLARVGINVRGRSRKLTVNYRTTQEILALAVPSLGKTPVTGLDDAVDTLAGYRSPLHGGQPEVHAAVSREAELAALVERVQDWIVDGIEPHAIGIAARTGWLAKQASAALAAADIPTAGLAAKAAKDAVRVGTMHGMKGLEFQAVAVFGVAEGSVPSPAAITPASEDPIAHAQDLQRERCLLFVACTRARDHLYVSYSGVPSTFLSVIPVPE